MVIKGASASEGLMITKEAKQISGEGKRVEGDITKIGQSKNSKNDDIDKDKLIKAVDDANKSLEMYNRELRYSVHEVTKDIMIKIIDTSEGREEVIKEIPPKKILDMMAEMWKMAGLIVDEKA